MPNGVPMAWMVGSYHHLPLWVESGSGAHFTDVDGHVYRDFNIADLSMFCGYAPEPVVRAVSDRVARGNQFMLPVEDAIVVSEELARRYGLPKWQYTSSATHANTEAIRVARVATGREKVVMFDGKYHGHLDEALVELDETGEVVIEERGVPEDTVDGTVLVPFNDPAALARALERRDVAARADRARDHQQHRPPAARRRLPRRAPPADPRDRHAAGHRRDPHPGLRPGRADAPSGASSRTCSSPASRSQAACRSAPGA